MGKCSPGAICKRLWNYKLELRQGHTAQILIVGTGLAVTAAMGVALYQFRTATLEWPQAVLTGSLILLLLAFTGARERWRDKEAAAMKKQAEAVSAQKDDLITILRTSPPPGPLSDFVRSYRYTWYYLRELEADNKTGPVEKLAEVEEEIRAALKVLATFFAQYQHKPINSICSANIALFIPVEDILGNPAVLNEIKGTIRFVDNPENPLHDLAGVLYVNPNLSGYSEQQGENQGFNDPEYNTLSLPVPASDSTKSGLSRFIPVSPLAFTIGRYFISDVKLLCNEATISTWDVRKHVSVELAEYFRGRAENRIGTILSERLIVNYEAPKAEGQVHIGVVNIHSAGPAGFDETIIQTFIDQSRPMLELLKQLLVARNKLNLAIGKAL